MPSEPKNSDKLLKASSTTTTTTTTTTRMVIKDTRRLYARRQQVVVNAAQDRVPHDVAPADDPFEPRLDLQLRGWYQWLLAHGGDAHNSTMVPDAVPTLTPNTTRAKHN